MSARTHGALHSDPLQNDVAGQPGVAAVRALCDRYGLRSDPFAEAPDRFFSGGQRQFYLETLRHLCSFGDLLLSVEGEPGVGRSRLVAEFSRTDSRAGQAGLEFHPLTADDCGSVTALARALWGMLRQPPPEIEAVSAVAAFFSATYWQKHSGKRWVLLIDDADRLLPEVIDVLARGFRQGERSKAPVPLLVAGPGFAAELESRAGQDTRWTHELVVRRLDEDESAQFVESCFAWAGGDPRGLLGPERRRQLYQNSAGNLARLIQVAPEVILGGGQAPRIHSGPVAGSPAPVRDRSRLRRNSLWLIVGLALLGVSYGLVSWQYNPADTVPEQGDPPETAQLEPVPERGSDEIGRMRDALAQAERRLGLSAADGETVAAPTTGAPGRTLAPVQPGSEPLLPESLGLSLSELVASAVEPPASVEPPPPATAPDSLPTEDANPAGVQTTESAPPDPDSAPAAVDSTSVQDTDAAASTQPPEAVPQPQSAAFEPILPSAFRDRDWVEALPAGTLTVQLLGSYHEDTAADLIRRYSDAGFIYVRSTYRGEVWFVVLLGIFDDTNSARAAMQQLPARIKSAGPWIRGTDGL